MNITPNLLAGGGIAQIQGNFYIAIVFLDCASEDKLGLADCIRWGSRLRRINSFDLLET